MNPYSEVTSEKYHMFHHKFSCLKSSLNHTFYSFDFIIPGRVDMSHFMGVGIFQIGLNWPDLGCSINFEPPDIDLCSGYHVYPISRGASIISVLFIANRFTWEVELG